MVLADTDGRADVLLAHQDAAANAGSAGEPGVPVARHGTTCHLAPGCAWWPRPTADVLQPYPEMPRPPRRGEQARPAARRVGLGRPAVIPRGRVPPAPWQFLAATSGGRLSTSGTAIGAALPAVALVAGVLRP